MCGTFKVINFYIFHFKALNKNDGIGTLNKSIFLKKSIIYYYELVNL